jgi:hypothetical protein
MREGEFNISIKERIKTHGGDQTLVNCCGHGGSGWTTLFGSVQKAIELFQSKNVAKNTSIRIIGSGCMGLTTAIELNRLGYANLKITAKEQIEITSYRAAGYFALVSVQTSEDKQEELNIIGMNTFKAYQEIDRGEHPYITKEAVKYLPVYCSNDTESGVEPLEEKGLIPKREAVTLDFCNGVTHPNFVKFMTYYMNTASLMQQLSEKVQMIGIPIHKETIQSFDDVEENIVFNCTGLGSRELNQDDKMIPVYGHLLTYHEQAGNGHMEYMIYTKVKQDDEEEYVYLFPRDVNVTREYPQGKACKAFLGGTFIKGVDSLSMDAQIQLHEREFKRMEIRGNTFFHGRSFEDS